MAEPCQSPAGAVPEPCPGPGRVLPAPAKGKGAGSARQCSWSKGTAKVGESSKSHLAWKSVMLVPDLICEHRVERKREKGEKREGEGEGEEGKGEGEGEGEGEIRREKGGKKEKEGREGEERKRISSPGSIGAACGMWPFLAICHFWTEHP
ncbi:hypothetical protein TURU_118605 [Turdus rufiventris]|nr:hypothetical protein TURU_118605 [Turdus rufiventris]